MWKWGLTQRKKRNLVPSPFLWCWQELIFSIAFSWGLSPFLYDDSKAVLWASFLLSGREFNDFLTTPQMPPLLSSSSSHVSLALASEDGASPTVHYRKLEEKAEEEEEEEEKEEEKEEEEEEAHRCLVFLLLFLIFT